MRKIGFFLLAGWLWSCGYGLDMSVYLLDGVGEGRDVGMIRGIPALRLVRPSFFVGWFREGAWVRLEVSHLKSDTSYVLWSGSRWVTIHRVFLFRDGLFVPLVLEGQRPEVFLPGGQSFLVIDMEVRGHPLLIAPRVMEARQWTTRKALFVAVVGGLVVLFAFFWGWYGFLAWRTKNHSSLWKALNFFLLGCLVMLVFFPPVGAFSWILPMMGIFGVSWTLYQLFCHPMMKRPDMMVLHLLFLVLIGVMGVVGAVNPVVGFFLFGVAIHFHLILLIFYYQVSARYRLFPWHVLFLVAWIGFFWEMMGVWTALSPLSPWLIFGGLLSYLIAEWWEVFRDVYLHKTLHQFYQNTNRLLKSHLASSNRKLQETVVALKKETQEKARLAHLYETQQKKYHDLLENLSDWIWEMNHHMVITYTSSRVRDMLGVAVDQVVGQSIERLIGREAYVVLKQALHRAGGWVRGHLLALTVGERSLLLEIASTPLMRDGKLQGYRCIARDVSQLIAMRNDLSLYRKDLTVLFDQSPLAIAMIDPKDMSIRRWNKRFEEMFPLEKSYLSDFVESIGDPYAKDVYFSLKQVMEGEKHRVYSLSLPYPMNGKTVWVVAQLFCVSLENERYAILTIFPPESGLFEKQWEWLSRWSMPVVVMDKYGHLLLSNDQATDLNFRPTLPSPFPTEVTVTRDDQGRSMMIVPRGPFLCLVFGMSSSSYGKTPLGERILEQLPVPWVVLSRDFQVVGWHPEIFRFFHFQTTHPRVLAPMIKESGILKEIEFTSTPSHRVRTAYFRNQHEEVFCQEVHLFVFEEYAWMVFFPAGTSSEDQESLPLFLRQLTLFSEELRKLSSEIASLERLSIPATLQPTPGEDEALRTLTEAEKRILLLVVMGKTNAEIASLQQITEETVKGHLKRIFKKLGVSKRYQLIQRYQGQL